MKNLEFKPVSMPCTQEQWDNELKPALDKHKLDYRIIEAFIIFNIVVNNIGGCKNSISNVSELRKDDHKRTFIPEFNVKEFIEACGVEYKEESNTKPMKKYKNYEISATDVLRIHSVACFNWKDKFAKDLAKMTINQTLYYSEKEIDAMFKAAESHQRPLLVEIFGEPKKPIDYDRIKAGSVVMLKGSGSAKQIVIMLNVPYYIYNNLWKSDTRNTFNIYANVETGNIHNKLYSIDGKVSSPLEEQIEEVISY